MNKLNKLLDQLDKFQQRHPVLALPIAVIKHYGNDQAGYQAALITYYGFLSLFPLLMVATSVIGLLVRNNPRLEHNIMSGVGSNFPLVGDQLTRNIHASKASGIALIVGLVITLYGSRGVADAFRAALNNVWKVDKRDQPGFPKSVINSTWIIAVGGLGLLSASLLSTYASALGGQVLFKLMSILASLAILIPTFFFLIDLGLPSKAANRHDKLLMAITTSGGILIVQNLGSYIMARRLQTLSPLYGTFSLVLGLLFWIYLQATVLMYAIEIQIVRKKDLWPRSFR